jgi:hypothetical protein
MNILKSEIELFETQKLLKNAKLINAWVQLKLLIVLGLMK